MNEKELDSTIENLSLQDYKILETHLHGEIIKACRSYTGQLNIISILGILDLVKQEIQDLEKTDLNYTKKEEAVAEEFVTDRLA